jgi:hypothetical protein
MIIYMSGKLFGIFPVTFRKANSTAIVLDFSCSPCCSQPGDFYVPPPDYPWEKTKNFGGKNAKKISVNKIFPLPLL